MRACVGVLIAVIAPTVSEIIEHVASHKYVLLYD